ncbi:MAG: signal peptidase II [Holosporaceae bacterium]|jgi:signal peptidase II|nr:signal peptidase II [Holosporaceae bacterium]
MYKVPKSFSSAKLAALLSVIVIIADQSSKWAILTFLEANNPVRILPFFNIVLVKNSGVAFGAFSDSIHPIILIIVSSAMAISLILWSSENKRYRLQTALVTGGAVGNILDRIFYDHVIDFIDFHIFGYHWPAFNIADSSIVVGVALLVFIAYKCKDFYNSSWRV